MSIEIETFSEPGKINQFGKSLVLGMSMEELPAMQQCACVADILR
jgi:hypothetical protein